MFLLLAAVRCQELTNIYVVDYYAVDLTVQQDSCDIFVTEYITYTFLRGNFSAIERDIFVQSGNLDSVVVMHGFDPDDQQLLNSTFSDTSDPDDERGNLCTIEIVLPADGVDAESHTPLSQINITISFWWREGLVENNFKNLVVWPGGELGWANLSPANFDMNVFLPFGDLRPDQISADSVAGSNLEAGSVSSINQSESSFYVSASAEMIGTMPFDCQNEVSYPTVQFSRRVKNCQVQFTNLDLTNLVLAIVLPIGSVIVAISACVGKCYWNRIRRRRAAARILREELQLRQIGVQKEPTPQPTPQTGFAMA